MTYYISILNNVFSAILVYLFSASFVFGAPVITSLIPSSGDSLSDGVLTGTLDDFSRFYLASEEMPLFGDIGGKVCGYVLGAGEGGTDIVNIDLGTMYGNQVGTPEPGCFASDANTLWYVYGLDSFQGGWESGVVATFSLSGSVPSTTPGFIGYMHEETPTYIFFVFFVALGIYFIAFCVRFLKGRTKRYYKFN